MATQRRSLRVELIATLAIVLMMAAVSLSLVTEVLGGRRHLSQERTRLQEHARGLALLTAPVLRSAAAGEVARAEIEQILRPSVGSLGIQTIEIWRHGEETTKLTTLGVPSPSNAPQHDGQADALEHEGLLLIDQPIPRFESGSPPAPLTLRLVAQPSPWTSGGEWQETLILALGVGLILLVLGGLLLEAQVLRPLAAVRTTADRVAAGDLAARAPDEGPAEVQAMASAFNRMTQALQHNIDEIQAQRERLVRSEQLASVGRVSAGVAHEIGNPLAAILGYVELLLDSRHASQLTPEQRSILERTRDQLQRIQGIVGQLLEYSRPARKTARPVELGALIGDLLTLLQHDPRTEGVALRVVAPKPVSAWVDPALLEQVLQNLVINGCRASRDQRSDPPPAVTVFVEAVGDRVQIDVQDTGAGVSPEARDNLFQPFYTTAKAGEGTGLGLAISLGLIERLDGTLVCLPEDARPPLAPGAPSGAVFRLTLPRPSPENPEPDSSVQT